MKAASKHMAPAALVTAATIWGASFFFGKVALAELHVAHLVLYRSLVATIVLLPLGRPPKRADLPLFFLTGFLMVPVTFLLQFAGLALTTATSATLIVGALPPAIAAGAALFGRERLAARDWIALGASSLGVALVVPGSGHDWRGDVLVLLSLLVVVVWVLLSKRLLASYSPGVVTAYLHVTGTLTLAPIAIAWAGPPKLAISGAAWGSVVALGLGCSALAYLLWNWALGRMRASSAGLYANIEPLVGVALGTLMLGERLEPRVLLGGAIIVCAAVATSLPSRRSLAPRRRTLGGEERRSEPVGA